MKKVQIYTINCPFCEEAKKILKEKDIPFEEIDVKENVEEYSKRIIEFYDIKEELTFPQIIIGKERIGGLDKLKELDEKDKLKEMIED